MFNFFKNQSGVSVVESLEQTKDNNKNILIDVSKRVSIKMVMQKTLYPFLYLICLKKKPKN